MIELQGDKIKPVATAGKEACDAMMTGLSDHAVGHHRDAPTSALRENRRSVHGRHDADRDYFVRGYSRRCALLA